MNKFFVLIFFFVLGCTKNTEPSASFDCKKATTPLEKTICSNVELRRIDGELGKIYKKLAKTPRLNQDHKWWLELREKRCKLDVDCLIGVYQMWIGEYRNALWFYEQDFPVGCYIRRNEIMLLSTTKSPDIWSLFMYKQTYKSIGEQGKITKEYGYYYYVSDSKKCQFKLTLDHKRNHIKINIPENDSNDCMGSIPISTETTFSLINDKRDKEKCYDNLP